MWTLRRTALETPSLNRNQTSLLPTAVPMRRSAASISGAASPVKATWLLPCLPLLPPPALQPLPPLPHPKHLHSGLLLS